jgi:hypothetical protein
LRLESLGQCRLPRGGTMHTGEDAITPLLLEAIEEGMEEGKMDPGGLSTSTVSRDSEWEQPVRPRSEARLLGSAHLMPL